MNNYSNVAVYGNKQLQKAPSFFLKTNVEKITFLQLRLVQESNLFRVYHECAC